MASLYREYWTQGKLLKLNDALWNTYPTDFPFINVVSLLVVAKQVSFINVLIETVHSQWATTSCKRPTPISDHLYKMVTKIFSPKAR